MLVECTMCHKTYDVPVTDEQIRKWNGGELIQNAMPNLTPDQRELLISRTCGPCFDKLFRDEGNFYISPSLEQLAAAQGVAPLKDLKKLSGVLADEEVEDFISAIYESREQH